MPPDRATRFIRIAASEARGSLGLNAVPDDTRSALFGAAANNGINSAFEPASDLVTFAMRVRRAGATELLIGAAALRDAVLLEFGFKS
jgi:hypothetical protein